MVGVGAGVDSIPGARGTCDVMHTHKVEVEWVWRLNWG